MLLSDCQETTGLWLFYSSISTSGKKLHKNLTNFGPRKYHITEELPGLKQENLPIFPSGVQIAVSFLEISIFTSCTHGTALISKSNRVNHIWIYLSTTTGLSDPKWTLLLYARQCARHLHYQLFHLATKLGGRR